MSGSDSDGSEADLETLSRRAAEARLLRDAQAGAGHRLASSSGSEDGDPGDDTPPGQSPSHQSVSRVRERMAIIYVVNSSKNRFYYACYRLVYRFGGNFVPIWIIPKFLFFWRVLLGLLYTEAHCVG